MSNTNNLDPIIAKNHYEWCQKEGRKTGWYKPQAAGVDPEKLHAYNSARFVEGATSSKQQATSKPKPEPSSGSSSKLQASGGKSISKR